MQRGGSGERDSLRGLECLQRKVCEKVSGQGVWSEGKIGGPKIERAPNRGSNVNWVSGHFVRE